MDTTVDSKAERVEAPERIWLTQPYYHPLRDALRIVHEQPPPVGGIEYRRFRHDSDCPATFSMAIDACTCVAPNTRQRAERAAVTIAEMVERGMNFYIGGARRREMADIIAAEFQK